MYILYVCMYVCMYVCICVFTYVRGSHTIYKTIYVCMNDLHVCMYACNVCSKQQVERLNEMKQKRNSEQVKIALDALSESAKRFNYSSQAHFPT